MVRIDQPPKHVRVEVGTGEIEKEDTFFELRELPVENRLVLREHGTRLFEILSIA